MDGYYCIVTSEQEIDYRELIDAYQSIWRIEESFRVIKGNFDTRPVFVPTQSPVKAHFLICYIALLIMKLMQLDTAKDHSSTKIAEALSGIIAQRIDANIYLFDYRNDLTDKLAEAVGLDLSHQVLKKVR